MVLNEELNDSKSGFEWSWFAGKVRIILKSIDLSKKREQKALTQMNSEQANALGRGEQEPFRLPEYSKEAWPLVKREAVRLFDSTLTNDALSLIKRWSDLCVKTTNNEKHPDLAYYFYEIGNLFLKELENRGVLGEPPTSMIGADPGDYADSDSEGNLGAPIEIDPSERMDEGPRQPENGEKQQDQGNSEAMIEEEEEEDEENDAAGENQVIFENLEAARVTAESALSGNEDPKIQKEFKLLLGNIHIRLGEYYAWVEQGQEGIKEYERALEYVSQVENPETSRFISEIHYLLAMTHLLINTEEAERVAGKHLELSARIMERVLASEMRIDPVYFEV